MLVVETVVIAVLGLIITIMGKILLKRKFKSKCCDVEVDE